MEKNELMIGTIPDSVEIDGFIKSPGKYPYAENMTVSDLLFSGLVLMIHHLLMKYS